MRKAIMCFVALLVIAAAATGPARAQSNTVTWEKYQISELNLMQGDRETIDDVTITCNDGTASNNGGDIKFNGEFTFSVPAGSVFTQIVIRDETWLSVTGWSVDEYQTGATWTGSARSVACHITTSNALNIEFTIASAVPKMYTSEVSITDLVPGDTLAEGATIIGSGDDDDMVFLAFGRTKKNGVVPSFWENLGLPPTVIGTNGTISRTYTYTPVDENGQDGNAWVVSDAILNDYDGFEVGLSGITIPVLYTVTFAEGMSGWQVQDVTAATSATAPAVLQNVMAGDSLVVTAPTTLPGKVKSVKAVKYVAPEVITWNTTNVLKEANQNDELNRSHRTPLNYEGITISFSGNDVSSFCPYSTAREYPALECHGDDGDSFTFTAPSGKKFTKIEINDNSYINFDAYGDWTKPENNKIVWRGTAANAVTLGSVFTLAGRLNSIVFTLIDD